MELECAAGKAAHVKQYFGVRSPVTGSCNCIAAVCSPKEAAMEPMDDAVYNILWPAFV